jgi:hypothetical protein
MRAQRGIEFSERSIADELAEVAFGFEHSRRRSSAGLISAACVMRPQGAAPECAFSHHLGLQFSYALHMGAAVYFMPRAALASRKWRQR